MSGLQQRLASVRAFFKERIDRLSDKQVRCLEGTTSIAAWHCRQAGVPWLLQGVLLPCVCTALRRTIEVKVWSHSMLCSV